MVVYWTLVVLSVLYYNTNGASINQAAPTLDPTLACSVDGHLVPNGQNFTIKINGPCFTFKCVNRAYIPIEFKCPYGDTCLAIGSNVSTSQCITQQCQKNGNYVGYNLIKDGCPGFGNTCIDVNATYQDGCTTYKCLKNDNTYQLAPVEWGCRFRNTCLKAGHTEKSQCQVTRCEKRGDVIGMYPIQNGCQYGDGQCLNVGEQGLYKCVLYSCETQNINGLTYQTTKPIAAMCEDSQGMCHSNGGSMQMIINGNITASCNCMVNGLNVGYQCSG
ncbi:hypothetical protein SNE40_019521 [Patella caerulea]|uniref:Uncharacterized protein n=1 Tax=Patella caerulea TaxID=87958 RepID=A0AAN8JAP4_PATCE